MEGVSLGRGEGLLDTEGVDDGAWEEEGTVLGALETLMPPPQIQQAVLTFLLSE